jgi:tRNA A-37 threonylcarbamoyl transferase component Bud32
MSAFFERLRLAFAFRYVLEREVAAGGMGIVFLAKDSALDRRVAIKVLRPELASAAAADRFLREARILANLTHPNVVSVHDVGEVEGVFYYTMDYIEGHSLAERLAQGPMPVREVVKLGRDLLDGLEAAHGLGVIHRDIKPGNVLLLHGRAMLSDFGIAKPSGAPPSSGMTDPNAPIGTPGYMPPEQELGVEVTTRTDIYAVGMVLYQALTGREWSNLHTDPAAGDWSGVPWAVASVLRRALAWDPVDRWVNAATFRRSLWHLRVRPYVRRTIGLTAAGLVAGASIVVAIRGWPGPVRTGDLTVSVAPFSAMGGPAGLGDSMALALVDHLSGFPDFRVAGPGTGTVAGATVSVTGSITADGDSLQVTLRMLSAGDDAATRVVQGTARRWPLLADSLARLVLNKLWDATSPLAASLPVRALPRTTSGVGSWLRAERLLAQGRYNEAYRAYLETEAADSTCVLCSWRLREVERWLGLEPDPRRTSRYLVFVDSFPPAYRPLIRAGEQPLAVRMRTLSEATERFGDFFLAWFQRGDEQLHRAPLIGRRRSEAIESFSRARTLRPDFTPAREHLTWALIAEGDSAAAAEELDSLAGRGAPADPTAVQMRALLQVSFAWRFLPEEHATALTRQALAAPGIANAPDIAAGPRFLMSFEAPRGAVVLGGMLAERRDRRELARSGLIAQALGFLALGRTDSMRLALTSLRDRFPEPELSLFAAELEGLLILAGDSASARWDNASRALERAAAAQPASERAVVLLALLGVRDPRVGEVRTQPLAALVTASASGRRGRWAEAISRTDPLLGDTAGARAAPFFRTALHLLRAKWFSRLEADEQARDELRWHENEAVDNYPTGAPQAGDVDWAFATIGRWQRAAALERLGPPGAELCACYASVVRLWAGGEPVFAARADSARARLTALNCASR